MGFLFKVRYSIALPVGATLRTRRRKPTAKELRRSPDATFIEEQIASWIDGNGRKEEGIVSQDNPNRVTRIADTWSIEFRNADGKLQRIATGCKDRTNAQDALAEQERLVERIKRGIVTPSDLSTADCGKSAIATHIEDYLTDLANKRGKGRRARVSALHLRNVRSALERIVHECGFQSLREIDRQKVSQWVSDCLDDAKRDWAHGTINAHVKALKAFCSWCVASTPQRMTVNPLAQFAMLGEELKRPRRALTIEEIARLLQVVRLRPVAEFGREIVRTPQRETGKTSGRKGSWKRAPLTFYSLEACYARGRDALKPSKLSELEALGQERELIYLVLVTTGLRKGELESITVGQCHLESNPAWIELDHKSEKNGKGSSIALRDDVADRLREYLSIRSDTSNVKPSVLPMRKSESRPLDEPLFRVPRDLVRILDRDLLAAGIPKINENGESVDVHAMRHSFATMLSVAGVAPRTAQELMRHSSIELTMKRYTHLTRLDTVGALASLPAIGATPSRTASRATGTDDSVGMNKPHEPSVVLACKNDQPRRDCHKTLQFEGSDISSAIAMNDEEQSTFPQQKQRENVRAGEGIRTLDFQLGKQKADGFSPTKTQGKNDSQELPTVVLAPLLSPDSTIAPSLSVDADAIQSLLDVATPAGLKVMRDALKAIATIPGMTVRDPAETHKDNA